MTTDANRSKGDAASSSHRYALKEVIGRGGMATVYRAFDEAAEMDVAIKILHEHLIDDAAMVEALQREAAVMRRVDHPGVVDVYATVEIDGRPGIAMELCEGGDLRRRLARRGSFDEDEALDIVIPLLDTLAACHEEGLVHRDVKPHNVVFDDRENPRLIDFGIGQAEELMAADEAGQVGTVEYMAPERIDGLAIDGRSDLYSVGVLLFELLCGHVPYRAESASEVLRMHREADVPDARVFEPAVSAPVAEAIMCAMAKQPEKRFDHPEQMVAALRGEDATDSEIPGHSSWKALREHYGAHSSLGASAEGSGEEWVIYVPPHLVEEGARQGADYAAAIGELIDDYGPYLTVADDEGHTVDSGGRGQELVARYGIARGLSRQGAEALTKRLEHHNLLVRFNRRVRHRRRESPWTIRATSLATLEAVIRFAD